MRPKGMLLPAESVEFLAVLIIAIVLFTNIAMKSQFWETSKHFN
jgi:hypothetical protein